MERKIDLDEYIDKEEEALDLVSNEKYKKIADELTDAFNYDFRRNISTDEYQIFDYALQNSLLLNQKDFETIHSILKNNGIPDMAYIERGVLKMSEIRPERKSFMQSLFNKGFIKDAKINPNGTFEIVVTDDWTIHGANVSTVYKGQPKMIQYMDKRDKYGNLIRVNGCHNNALFLLNYFQQGEAITARCCSISGQKYFHSFFRNNGYVIDLNINLIMKEEDYFRMNSPEIMSIVTRENYTQKMSEVRNNTTHTLCDLLAIAAYEDIKRKRNVNPQDSGDGNDDRNIGPEL